MSVVSCHLQWQEGGQGDLAFSVVCVLLLVLLLRDGDGILRPGDVSSLHGRLRARLPLLPACAFWTLVLPALLRDVLVRRRRLLHGLLRGRRAGGTFVQVILMILMMMVVVVLVVLGIWAVLVSVWIWLSEPTLMI